MATVSLSEKVLLIEEGLRQRRIPHAFGGALALAYYATPRATIDIDVNVFALRGSRRRGAGPAGRGWAPSPCATRSARS